jgi:hypothetical protein
MNKILIALLAFSAGAGLGIFLTKRHFDNLIDEVLEEELNNLREMYSKDEEALKEFMSSEDNAVRPVEREEGYDYTKYATDDDEIPENVNTISEAEEVEDMLSGDKAPYFITANEFLSEEQEYEKIGLYYYDRDETLTDDLDEVIEDYETIGDDSLSVFNDDPNISAVYIRNEAMEADYEIVRVIGSYHENN